MAQSDNGRSTPTIDVPRPQNSPGSKSSRTQGDSSSWSFSSSLKLRRNHDNDDHGNNQKKSSVFSKVKEKARKLKKSLSGRKRRDENELRSPNFSTPPGSAGHAKDNKQHPQYFSSPTPLEGSSISADTKKNSLKEHPQETIKESSETVAPPSKNEPPPTNDDSPEATGTRDANDSKTSSEPIENNESNIEPQDKGVSVTEYLMNKLEPGEDERALSQVITQTISPKCEKVKEAVNSLLRTEEPVSNTSNSEPDTTPADSDSNQDTGARSSIESVDIKLTSLNAHDPSDGPETRLSNASDISRGSELTSTSCQNENPKQSS